MACALPLDGAPTVACALPLDGASTVACALPLDGASTVACALPLDGASTVAWALPLDGASTVGLDAAGSLPQAANASSTIEMPTMESSVFLIMAFIRTPSAMRIAQTLTL